MSELWDAPNQQVVRADQSAPWEEGTGGGEDPGATPKTQADENPLDGLTKAQLLEHGQSLGLDVDDTQTKAEIKAAIEEA